MGRAVLLRSKISTDYDEVQKPQRKAKPKPERSVVNTVATQKTNLSLKEVRPLNEAQKQMMQSFDSGLHVIAGGSAGTGKSYIAMYLGLSELMDGNIETVKIIRSAVPTRNSGFLPGSLAEKNAVYELPYRDIVNDLCSCGTAYEVLSKKGAIEFMTSGFLRGLTFKNCVIVIDEFQSMNFHEAQTILTRVGPNCRVILCGDTRQCDFDGKKDLSGYDKVVSIASRMSSYFDIVNFTKNDIVRSAFVKAWITEAEDD
jgi:phosphate starvation-inducible PhoH-like protein